MDYVGRRFGKLVVKRQIPTSDNKLGGLWECDCDCGGKISARAYRLHTRNSCGCLGKSHSLKKGLLSRKPESMTISSEYTNHRNNAKQRGYAFLDKKDWLLIVKQPCHYCGEIDTRNRATMATYQRKCGVTLTPELIETYSVSINGVDRVDSSKGYEIENCVPCCSMCNRMKNGFEYKDFLSKIEKIYSNHCMGV